ncbi:hypothetical protein ACI8AF_13360 [Blastococcus sp. SYSU D00669]
MTGPRTVPLAVPAAPAAAGTDREVLQRAAGVELLGEIPGSGYRRPPALARRGDGQVVTLTPLVQQVLAAVDGSRTVAEVADAVGAATGRLVRPDDVRQLVDRSLRPMGLLLPADGREPELRRSAPLLGLRFRRVVTDPAVTRRVTAPFAVLFSPLVVVPVVLAFAAVAFWVLFREGLAAATAQAFAVPGVFLAIVLVTVLSAGFHEFGHAAAARYGGATPGAMGFGLYLLWPAFYTDVTDSYRLGRAGRVRTDLGGLYFNAVVVLLTFAVWWGTGWHAVLLVVATQILQMVRQLAPLLRFDGYHVLADVTGVPDLYQRIGPVLRGLLPGRRRSPEAAALEPWARVVVTLWVLLVVPLMLGTFLLMVLALPRLLGTAWASVREQASLVGGDVGDGDILGALARALAVVAVVLPIAGLLVVLASAVRRAAAGVRRRTEGRPGRRALALVVAAALLAGLAWAWWPAGDRYRPVQPYEGGTVLDAVPAALGGSAPGLDQGSRGTGLTIWPDDGPLPTADAPALALVLTPASQSSTAADGPGEGTGDGGGAATDAPTWVFPFDRPLPPGEGDNQALAVNTEDGSVLYDVSFSLIWVEEGDEALNRNEAFAAASCTGCRTVAVAFQVVVLVGSVDVVVPQNLATAVNYACVECVTAALATQLVVSVPGPLGEEAGRELAAVWAELRAFGEQIAGLSLSELRDRLTEFEERILAVVQQAAEEQPPEQAATGSGSATPTGTPSGGAGTADGTADDGAGDAPAGTEEDAAPTGEVGEQAGTTTPDDASTGGTATDEPAATTSAPAEESAELPAEQAPEPAPTSSGATG